MTQTRPSATAPKAPSKILTLLLIFLMIALMSGVFWMRTDTLFQNDSESLAVGMIAAQKYDLDVSTRGYGLGQLYPTTLKGEYVEFVRSTYDIYYHGMSPDVSYTLDDYVRHIGLQGWVFYALSGVVPHALTALRLFCCIALSGVIVWISPCPSQALRRAICRMFLFLYR